MEILLDTSFLVTCVKEGIDIFDSEKYGFLLLPKEVLGELRKLKKEGKPVEKSRAGIALQIIRENMDKFKIVKLNESYVDKGILDYIKDKENIAVATLDKELKKKLRKRVKLLTVRGGKKIMWE